MTCFKSTDGHNSEPYLSVELNSVVITFGNGTSEDFNSSNMKSCNVSNKKTNLLINFIYTCTTHRERETLQNDFNCRPVEDMLHMSGIIFRK